MGDYAPWVCGTQAGRLSVPTRRHEYVLFLNYYIIPRQRMGFNLLWRGDQSRKDPAACGCTQFGFVNNHRQLSRTCSLLPRLRSHAFVWNFRYSGAEKDGGRIVSHIMILVSSKDLGCIFRAAQFVKASRMFKDEGLERHHKASDHYYPTLIGTPRHDCVY